MSQTYGELTIMPASSFGYIVRANYPSGYESPIACAGSLDECLEYIRKTILKHGSEALGEQNTKTDGESV